MKIRRFFSGPRRSTQLVPPSAFSIDGTLLTRSLPLGSPFGSRSSGIYPRRSHAYVFPQSSAALKCCSPGSQSTAPLPSALVQPLAFRTSSAFSLIEVVIAIGIAAFCMVAMIGLLPSGLKSAKNTTDQTAAASLLDDIALDLQSTPAGSSTTPMYGLTLPTAGSAAATASANFFFNEDGSFTNTSTDISTRYGALLTMSNPTATTTTAWIQIYWPPTVATNNLAGALGIVESFVTINRQ